MSAPQRRDSSLDEFARLEARIERLLQDRTVRRRTRLLYGELYARLGPTSSYQDLEHIVCVLERARPARRGGLALVATAAGAHQPNRTVSPQ